MNPLVHYVAAITALAVVFALIYAAGGLLKRSGVLPAKTERLVSVIETTPLQNSAALHVVRVADRYYLVGANPGGLGTLAEIPAERVDQYIKSTRIVRSDRPPSR